MSDEVSTSVSTDSGSGDTGGGMDIDAGVAEISSGLGFGKPEAESSDDLFADTTETTEQPADDVPDEGEQANNEPTERVAEVTARPAPRSWAKETHEHWAKIPKEAQEYIEKRENDMTAGLEQYKENSGFGKQIREIMTPYKALLQAQGVDEPKAIQYLLNAHYRLTNGQASEKAQYLASLAQSYGIDVTRLTQGEQQQQVAPEVQALQEKVNRLELGLTAREQASLNEARAKAGQTVNTFASDPKNGYFEEVADDIVKLIETGETLEAAYEKAVWANPVTRAKEMARIQTENEAKLRGRGKLEAAAALKAKSSNIRTRDTSKAPTESRGKLFGDSHEAEMREIVRKGSPRTH